ncbi:DsbA family oxidoreductase [Nocardioides insulae]|uniref:DsbA family oxidoreductase n=1 Tax=Nocardioides insulae TaxID=394734 RepID=UPI000409AAB5|nr:DsbA family oxidoreductase [Nocardioides insulae]
MAALDPSAEKVTVDVWSDIVCPFCFMGDTLLAQAVEASGLDVELRYHSYQLMPELPEGATLDLADHLAEKFGTSRDKAVEMNEQVSARAAEIGLDYHLDRALPTNTLPAHRLAHWAAGEGRQHALILALFRAYFTDGRNVGDHEVLADLAAEAGLPREEPLAVLGTESFAEEVQQDIALAQRLGISGVPFFVFDGKYAVSGAQPVEVFRQALDTAVQARGASPA